MRYVLIFNQFLVALPCVLGFWKWSKLQLPVRLLIGLLLAWLIAEVCYFVLQLKGYQNLIVSYPLSLAELLLLGEIFSILLNQKWIRYVFWSGIGVLLIEILLGSNYNSYTLAYECLTVSIFSIMTLRKMSEGIISVGVGYLIGSLFILFLTSAGFYLSYLTTSQEILRMYGVIHSGVLFICYLSISISLWKFW